MIDKNRKGTTVTVKVSNPLDATYDELLAALNKDHPYLPGEQVEYINWRNEDGSVCFGVSWEITP